MYQKGTVHPKSLSGLDLARMYQDSQKYGTTFFYFSPGSGSNASPERKRADDSCICVCRNMWDTIPTSVPLLTLLCISVFSTVFIIWYMLEIKLHKSI